MLSYLILALIGVALAPAGFLLTWYYNGKLIPTLVIGTLVLGAVGVSVAAVAKLGMQRFLKLAIEVLLIGIVLFTSLALGGAPAWTWLVTQVAVALAVILWAVKMIDAGKFVYVKTPLNLLLILLVLYIFFQLVPMPAGILKTFQSNTLRTHTVGPSHIEEVARRPLTAGSAYPISLNRARTRGHLFLTMAYVGFFLVLINNVTTRAQLGRMIAAVIVAGGVTALGGFATLRQEDPLLYRTIPVVGRNEFQPSLNADANPEFSLGYGVMTHEREGDNIDFYVRRSQTVQGMHDKETGDMPFEARTGGVFGGFVRANSAATVLIMATLLVVGLIFGFVATRRTEWGQSGGLLYTREGNTILLLCFALALLLGGLGITRSRGALATILLTLPLLIILIGFSRSLTAGVVTVAVIGLLVILPVVIMGSSEVGGFISAQAASFMNTPQESIRYYGRQSAWQLIGDYRMFGTGLGTFSSVFPSHNVRGPLLYFPYCDVLQWFAETGLVGLVLAGSALVTLFATVVTGWLGLKDPLFRRLLLGAAAACLAFLGHGLVDFPLQIPGVTIIFVTLAGVCLIVAKDRIARHEESDFTF